MSVESIEKTEPLRLANKGQTAQWFDVSPQALDGWIRRGCPAVVRGSAGVPWKFDLRALAEWRYARQATPEGSIDPANMSPKERLDHFRALREQAKHEIEMGQLIPAAEFETGIANVIKPLATGIESLPDLLERDVGLTGAQVEKAIQVCDQLREQLYKQLIGDAAA
jgi:phage terminase Nu1 subunit (DNA packaging protein)